MPRKSFPAALKAAFPHTVPILTGYLAVGLAYGLLMASKGYNFLWSGFVSAFAFCGSMQYVAITLLTTAFDPLSAFFLSLMVNARHLFFALALLPKYRGLGKLRYFLIYTLSDENFSLSSTVEPPEDMDPTLFYFAMSLLTWLYWIVFSMLGGLIGELITFDLTGIDFALTALFVVLFIYGWNQYLWPLLVTTSEDMYPIVIGIKRMIGGGDSAHEWNLIMATAMLAMIPPAIVVTVMQRWFVKGLVDTEK